MLRVSHTMDLELNRGILKEKLNTFKGETEPVAKHCVTEEIIHSCLLYCSYCLKEKVGCFNELNAMPLASALFEAIK